MSRSILANERPFGFAQPTFCLGLGSGDPNHPSAVTSTSDGRTYTYDANGNMLTGAGRTFTWDADNRVDFLTAQGGMVDMSYDYTGIRIRKSAPGGITYFPFAGYEIDPFGTVTKYIRIGNDNVAAKKGGDKLFYHNDHLGGVNVITDILGAMAQLDEYDPWGKVSRSEGSVDPTKRFTGKELDPESGLYYYGGRYYDPELGRFISPDPFVPQPGDPQSFNRYSYADNDPVNKIDPTGHFSFKKLFKGIGHFFKNLVQHPGRFFATLGVGFVGGWFLGPSVAGFFGAQGWGATAIAGAVGGAAAGMVGAAMSKGNIWQGALLGAVGGAVGGGVAATQGIIGGAVAGGAAAGALGTAFYRGNFFENLFVGGITNGLLGSVQALAKIGWEGAKTWTDSSAAEGNLKPLENRWGERVTAGTRDCPNCSSNEPKWYEMLPENSPINRIFGIRYDVNSLFGRFINHISKVHDWMNGWSYEAGNYVSRGPVFDRAFDVYSFTGMPLAAYTTFSFAPPVYYQRER